MIIDDPLVTVSAGEVEVNVINRVLDTEHAKAWNVDLVSKYARVASYSQSGGNATVHLEATKDTLYVNEELRGTWTGVSVQVPDWDWTVLAECARYTCRIVAYKPTYPEHPIEGEQDEVHQSQ